MNTLQLRHCATYDRHGVRTTQPELLTCEYADAYGIRIAIGADPLTAREYTLTKGEAAKLADWIQEELGKDARP